MAITDEQRRATAAADVRERSNPIVHIPMIERLAITINSACTACDLLSVNIADIETSAQFLILDTSLDTMRTQVTAVDKERTRLLNLLDALTDRFESFKGQISGWNQDDESLLLKAAETVAVAKQERKVVPH